MKILQNFTKNTQILEMIARLFSKEVAVKLHVEEFEKKIKRYSWKKVH